ncbi:sensor histidine kinase [Solidesulfovibrio aerotolerans]|uniref:sensor histidine kinase n=1 Tax=Solidesulfovibrio aerotolerans TaxID=295255 RepID=UPI001FECAF51|nr:ATP-binding protein [Solidesulfovibrio aerotolerans]
MNEPCADPVLARTATAWLAAAVIPLGGCLALVWGLGPEILAPVAAVAGAGGCVALAVAVLRTRRLTRHMTALCQEAAALRQQVVASGKLAVVGEQAAGVAHEINNPVAIMMEEAGWVLDILDGDDFATPDNLAEMRRALTQIRVQGARCKEITHLLLTYARKPDDACSNTDLNALITQLVALSGSRAKAARVQVTTALAADLPRVAAPASQLQQVLLNCINNAVDAMEPGGGALAIATSRVGDKVGLTVTDTGPGISPAVMERLFEPFFTTKAAGKGTGLGLSICAGIVRELGGEISVHSPAGGGAIFNILLPAAAQATPAPDCTETP